MTVVEVTELEVEEMDYMDLQGLHRKQDEDNSRLLYQRRSHSMMDCIILQHQNMNPRQLLRHNDAYTDICLGAVAAVAKKAMSVVCQ